MHQAPGQRRARDVHRPQAVVRRGRGADVPGALAQDRAHRGGRARRRAARQALLPARPGGPRLACARAPLVRGRGGHRAGADRRGGRDAGRRRAAPGRGGARRGGRRRGGRGRGGCGRGRRRRRGGRGGRAGTPRPSRRPPRPPEPAADAEAATPTTTSRAPRARAPGRWLGSKEKKREHNSLVELVTIVAVALGLALGIQAFLVKPFRIPSESMVPTLEVGQRVLVDRVSFRFSDPDRGDIVVFKPPAGADRAPAAWSARATSRARRAPRSARTRTSSSGWWAVPGDHLKVIAGSRLHQREAPERAVRAPRLRHARPATCPREITIPKGEYYMMGDNRGESRRQPRVGAGAEEVDHRQGLHDVLAARPNRPALGRAGPGRASAVCPPMIGATSGDTAGRDHPFARATQDSPAEGPAADRTPAVRVRP